MRLKPTIFRRIAKECVDPETGRQPETVVIAVARRGEDGAWQVDTASTRLVHDGEELMPKDLAKAIAKRLGAPANWDEATMKVLETAGDLLNKINSHSRR